MSRICLFTSIAGQEKKGHRTAEFWRLFHELSAAIVTFQSVLPPLEDPIDLLPFEVTNYVNPHLLRAHTCTLRAIIELYNLTAEDDQKAYTKTLDAALMMAEIIRRTRGASGMQWIQLVNPFLVSP